MSTRSENFVRESTNSIDLHEVGLQDGSESTDESNDSPAQPSNLRDGYRIQIPLPITQEVDTRVRRMVDRVMERLPPSAASSDRPVLILEFDTSNGATGEGSQFERCLALARYLTGSDLNRVRTVAYIPEHRGVPNPDELQPQSRLRGHAVLVAIACEELIMHRDGVIGSAGIDEPVADPLTLAAYESIAERRRVLPAPLVLSMVDKNRMLYRAELSDSRILFVNDQELTDFESSGSLNDYQTLSERGGLPDFTSAEMRAYGFIKVRVSSRLELARALNVKEESLQGDPSLGDAWRPIMLRIQGPVQQQDINWAVSALERAVSVDESNLIIVELDSDGGSLGDSFRLAQQLAGFDSSEVRTVAYIPKKAAGGAAMIALACHQIVMHPNAKLGGPSDISMDPQQLMELNVTIRDLAESSVRDWSIFAAVLNPQQSLMQYRNVETGRTRLLIRDQLQTLEDPDRWIELREVDTEQGIKGEAAERLLIARYLAHDFGELKAFYQLDEDPELLEPILAHRWIEDLGRRLSSPWIAGWLLFGAMFFLSTELSQPGLSIPGFLSAICFVLFFWSQYCDGNVQWFEILLLVVGAAFVLLEVFVLPGFGVFGVGGILMIVAALLLAMQSFVIPSSNSDLRQLPISIGVVFVGFSGVFVAFAVVRRFLPHVPVLNRMILSPPALQDAKGTAESQEYSQLYNETGVAVTPLTPSGKVQIGNDLVNVVTDGRYVERDSQVVVSEVHGNRIVVMPVHADESSETK